MNLLAAKAVEQRANYIRDKYIYGIDCNTCKYDYKYYAMQDYISDCYDVCETPTVSIFNKSIDCTGNSISFIDQTVCNNVNKILNCNYTFIKKKMITFEINSYLLNQINVLNNTLWFEFTNIIINGQTYLSSNRKFKLDSSNIDIITVNGNDYVKNIVNWLNSFNLPNFTFYPSDPNKMIVEYPEQYTWQIDTTANSDGDDLIYGVKINEDGIVSIQVSVGGLYTAPPYGGSASVWESSTETISTSTLC